MGDWHTLVPFRERLGDALAFGAPDVLIPVRFHDAMVIGVHRNDLAADWRRSPPPPTTQQIGDDWVQRQHSAVLRVPSAIVPAESNYLLNPAHPDFGRIEIGPPEEILIDSRLLR